MNPAERITLGILAPLRGYYILFSNPTLLAWALAPVVVALILFFSFVVYALTHATVLVDWLVNLVLPVFPAVEHYIGVIDVVALIILIPLMILTGAYFSFVLIKAIAAPFYTRLAERVIILKGGLGRPAYGFWKGLTVLGSMYSVAVAEILIQLVIGIVLIFLGFLPGLNILSAFGLMLILTFDAADYTFEVETLSLTERLSFFFSHLTEFSGFAFCMGALLLIPIVNFFAIPAAVAGASELICRIREREGADGSRTHS